MLVDHNTFKATLSLAKNSSCEQKVSEEGCSAMAQCQLHFKCATEQTRHAHLNTLSAPVYDYLLGVFFANIPLSPHRYLIVEEIFIDPKILSQARKNIHFMTLLDNVKRLIVKDFPENLPQDVTSTIVEYFIPTTWP